VGYRLGIDLGTTYSAAALERSGRAEIVPLGDHAPQVPSVLLFREDGSFLVGDSAVRRGVAEPGRLAREFKRRLGDQTGVILGGTPFSPQALIARLLRWVVDAVAERQGEPPDKVVVTHPANWGPYRRELLHQAVRLADVGPAETCTEPVAAAIHFASTERVEAGDVVAVYDLGGGTFDAAVLRKTASGFELLGAPEGIEQLGGVDFDEAVFAHVVRALGESVTELDPDDPAVVAALVRMRRECTDAKEALSTDTEVTIPVTLPTIQTSVRLTRAELEDMLRAPLKTPWPPCAEPLSRRRWLPRTSALSCWSVGPRAFRWSPNCSVTSSPAPSR